MIKFFKDAGVRETIESIIIAVMLALMFKAFEAEAYIIPTGSMATTLRGEHYDLVCDQCGIGYQTNCSSKRSDVRAAYCPICRYRTVLSPERLSNHNSFDGDRILVNKFIYDFNEPRRWDVIVFKNPKNAKQNYIKRLIGLPNESLLIEQGDIYTFHPQAEIFDQRRIARKSPAKLRAMMQLVDDTGHIGKKLQAANWPLRWIPAESPASEPTWTTVVEPKVQFDIDATQISEPRWLKYRHMQPRIEDWESLADRQLPERTTEFLASGVRGGGLVRDHYSYNEFTTSVPGEQHTEISGHHWVGDLGLEAWVQIDSESGALLLETTEGGAHFGCQIDIASGTVSLGCSDSQVKFVDGSGNSVAEPQGKCGIRGAGKHRLLFMNADNRLFLWVDGSPVSFGNVPFQDFDRPGFIRPRYSPEDPGDAQPLGIGSRGAKLQVSQLKVWRDVYYTSVTLADRDGDDYRINVGIAGLDDVLDNPTQWDTSGAIALFESQRRTERDLHPLSDDQYFPMGDNSPASQDARLWGDPPYVTRDLLLGRGLFLYWPHSLNYPFFGFPDFSRMKFIR